MNILEVQRVKVKATRDFIDKELGKYVVAGTEYEISETRLKEIQAREKTKNKKYVEVVANRASRNEKPTNKANETDNKEQDESKK